MIPPARSPRVRPALGLAVIAAVIIAAAVTVLAVVGDDDGQEMASSTSSTATSGGSTPDPTAEPTSSTTPGATTASSTTTTTLGDTPAAPWRAAPVARGAVPAVYAQAWDRARNKATCALLFPLDGGPEMPGAKATADDTPNNNGWDIFLTSGGASIEVLGLFDKASQAERTPGTGGFTRTWADGSVAKYGADVGGLPAGTFDPNTSPFEAVLTLPDQNCAYRVYDTLGKDHLEATFDRLRLMAK